MKYPTYLAATSKYFGDYGFKIISDKEYISYQKTGKTGKHEAPDRRLISEVVDQEIKNKNLRIISAAEAALLFGEI